MINKAKDEINEISSKYYIREYIPLMIILGIFQFTLIVICVLLLGSWKWIRESKLSDNRRNINIIYQLERILLLISVSFSGIALSISLFVFGILINMNSKSILVKIIEIYSVIVIILISNVFLVIQKCSKKLYVLFYLAIIIEIVLLFVMLIGYNYPSIIFSNINNGNITSGGVTLRVEIFMITLFLFFLIILIINTRLCQNYIDENIILQIYGPKNKQILLQNIKESLKKNLKKFLNFLGKKSKSDESYLKTLGINAWKFIPESRFLLLNIIKIDDETDNEDDEIENVYNGETDKIKIVDNDKNDDNIKIYFNAKSDVMIQTNYPLSNINNIPFDTIALNMHTSSTQPIEYWFYYYEITISSNPNNDKTIIAIGLATKNYSINRLPGCDTHSVGFHSDEGRTFHNEGYTGSKYAEKWGKVNDVIGCGYCPNTGQIFFTMNGKNLGIAYTSLFYNWYPTIGSNGFCSLNVNFGQKEFKYKEANGMSVAGIISQELLNKIEKEIINVEQ
ncbi:uncharacterized protein OCT59_015550 [Rhizophagus irregularis]|nr:hypothetical protein OCT59_015550 [Rhizophagus irregularis]CAB4474799.1 unnamed protein product [Rhizophagus irregularis]